MRTIVCILLALTTALASAKPKRTVSAVFFQAPGGAPEKIHAQAGKESLTINLPRMNLSDRVEIPSGDLLLGITLKPLAEGETAPANSPSVRIPENWSDVVLLVAENPKRNEFPIKVLPVNISPNAFKPGQLMCFNLTKAQVAGLIGEAKLLVKPGTSSITASPAEGDVDYPVTIDYIPDDGETPLPLSRTVWRNEPTKRHLLFILDDTERNVPRIWSVSVSPPPVDPEKSDGGAPPPAVP